MPFLLFASGMDDVKTIDVTNASLTLNTDMSVET